MERMDIRTRLGKQRLRVYSALHLIFIIDGYTFRIEKRLKVFHVITIGTWRYRDCHPFTICIIP
jgi:hypothetical protein